MTCWNIDRLLVLPLLCLAISGWLGCNGEPAASYHHNDLQYEKGAIVRADTSRRELALVFTADTYGEGGQHVWKVLKRQDCPAAFFFTGHFYRDPDFASLIRGLRGDGHYLGAHSDRHLLYCAWENRDSLLIDRAMFMTDLEANYREMARFGIQRDQAPYFLPPYEWYNDTISYWTREAGLQLINFSRGTRSHADYTTPEMDNYIDSQAILKSIFEYEQQDAAGLNGFILLSHIGTAPERTDKFYYHLDTLITRLKEKGYRFRRIDHLLEK